LGSLVVLEADVGSEDRSSEAQGRTALVGQTCKDNNRSSYHVDELVVVDLCQGLRQFTCRLEFHLVEGSLYIVEAYIYVGDESFDGITVRRCPPTRAVSSDGTRTTHCCQGGVAS